MPGSPPPRPRRPRNSPPPRPLGVTSRDHSVSALEDHLGYWLRLVSNQVSLAFQRRVEASGVTVAEWVILRTMLELGPSHPSGLADQIGLTRGAVSKLVARLVAKGLVDCAASERDGRAQIVSLTAKGRRLVPVLARQADENEVALFGSLSAAERSELGRRLRGLAASHGWKSAPIL